MNALWYTDGTDRKEFEGRKNISCRVAALENDYRLLMRRVMDMGECVRYYNLKDEPGGYWRELFRYQPLAILSEIERIDIRKLENHFLKSGRRKPVVMLDVVKKLIGCLDDWELRLVYYPDLQLSRDLLSRVKFRIPEEKEELKRLFYVLLEVLRKFQVKYDLYLEEIRMCGDNDPSLALMDTFLCHYSEIVGRFNASWQQWPDFYFRRILHARCRSVMSDHIWLSFARVPGVDGIIIEKGTAFIGGKGKGGSPVCYRTTEEMAVGNLKLARLYSYFQEKDDIRYPAARVGFVTGVSQNTIDLEVQGVPQKLFGESYDSRLELGLMVCSPVLLLRDGKRKVTVSFTLTEESKLYFQKMLTGISEKGEEKNGELVRKLLKDAFLLEITTSDGWSCIAEYLAVFREEECISLIFCLDKEFMPTVAAVTSLHGLQTEWPVLRIRMNPEAWLFPYSWMIAVQCSQVRLRAEVSGLSALKIYSHIGELDASTPFYPFGMQALRGIQFIFGSYEMAVKPLQKVTLHCKWLQLPAGPDGFYGYYREYNRQVNNYSFRVRTEWLDGKKWRPDKAGVQCLFGPAENGRLTATGVLPEDSYISWCPAREMPVYERNEDQYVYGKSSSGFFRMVLDSPEMGFGYTVYQTLFAEVMMANSHRRHPLPVPALPVSPLLESLEVEYEAEEEICFAPGQTMGRSQLFYMESASGFSLQSIRPDVPFYLAGHLGKTGNLLFGFTGVVGTDRIRFFTDIAAIRQEIDWRDGGETDCFPDWYMKRGREWYRLRPEVVVRDTTTGFINSGIVELLLPAPVKEDCLDKEGIFWLCARFSGSLIKQISVRGIFTNVVEAVLDIATVGEGWAWEGGLTEGTVAEAVKNIPGITSIRQITAGKGGRKEENEEVLKNRIIHRIRHRNRAVSPRDFEDLVLEHFPQIAKVKCLPGLDSKRVIARPGIVTLVVVPRSRGKMELPLCTHDLLSDIECLLQPMTGAFVQVDTINPLYEEMKVRCHISIAPGWSAAETILRLRRRIDELIAPWKYGDGIPVFGYRFAVQELRNRMMEDAGVSALHGLSVLQVYKDEEKLYRLNEYGDQGSADGKAGASCAWGIPVPAAFHLICTDKQGEWLPDAGIGEIGVEETFVIG